MLTAADFFRSKLGLCDVAQHRLLRRLSEAVSTVSCCGASSMNHHSLLAFTDYMVYHVWMCRTHQFYYYQKCCQHWLSSRLTHCVSSASALLSTESAVSALTQLPAVCCGGPLLANHYVLHEFTSADSVLPRLLLLAPRTLLLSPQLIVQTVYTNDGIVYHGIYGILKIIRSIKFSNINDTIVISQRLTRKHSAEKLLVSLKSFRVRNLKFSFSIFQR